MTLKDELYMNPGELTGFQEYTINGFFEPGTIRSNLIDNESSALEEIGVVKIIYDLSGSISMYLNVDKSKFVEAKRRINDIVRPYIEKDAGIKKAYDSRRPTV